jgi:hypothetical protein
MRSLKVGYVRLVGEVDADDDDDDDDDVGNRSAYNKCASVIPRWRRAAGMERLQASIGPQSNWRCLRVKLSWMKLRSVLIHQ